jgi:hypothetical protein
MGHAVQRGISRYRTRDDVDAYPPRHVLVAGAAISVTLVVRSDGGHLHVNDSE